MKTKDMEKLAERAGEELDSDVVAVANGTSDWQQKYARRARVLAVRQTRKVYSGQRWDWGGHAACDGVRVRYLDDEGALGGGGLAGREAIVGPRQVVALWSDHEATQKALAERETAAQARHQSSAQRAEDAALRLGGRAWEQFGVHKVILSIEQAEELVKLLDAAEQKSGVAS